MSKQLTLSASLAVLSMAAFAIVATIGSAPKDDATAAVATAPLFDLTVGR